MSTTLASVYTGTMFKKCCPHYVEDFDRCAGISVCSVKPVMPDQWDTIYLDNGLPRVNSAIADADFISKSCLPKVNSLYDWISAIRRNWNKSSISSKRKSSGVLEYEPFIKAARKGPTNNQYWQAVFGGAAGGGEPAGSYKYVVTPLSSTIPENVNWFFLEMQVFMFSKSNDQGALNAAGTIKKVQDVSGDLTIWVLPAPGTDLPGVGTATDFDYAILTRGLVNVTDYESFCAQIPALNTRQDAYYWVGSTRFTICDSEVQKEFIARVLADNPLYREYYHVDDVEYSRQMTEDYQRRMVENFFWGRALSVKQAHDTWDELDQITLDFDGLDLPDQGTCVGRRANPIGIVNQLSECNRVIDLKGARLDLASHVFEQVYYMDQIRKENGVETPVFEAWMNSTYARTFRRSMISYYKEATQDTMRMNLDLKPGMQEKFGFMWQDYVLDFPAGKILRVMTHPYFDSWFDAMRRISSVDLQSQGNMIWFLDWSSMYQAVLASSSIVNTTGSVQDLAKLSQDMACRMKTKRTSYRHNSLTFTNVAECPASSLMLQNISLDTPIHIGELTRIGIGRVPWDTTVSC